MQLDNVKSRKQYKITATIYDKKGRILAVASNSYQKTHPYQAALAQKVGKPYKQYLHAEVAAIIKASKYGIPYKIFIERYGYKHKPMNAEPCIICKEAIKLANIKLIEYTISW